MANKKTAKLLQSDVQGAVSTTTVFETKLNDIEKALKELKGLHQNYLDRYEKNTKKYNENIEIIGKSMDKANASLQKDAKAFSDLTKTLSRTTNIVEGSTVDTLDAVDMQNTQLDAIQGLIERTYESWNELDSKVSKINAKDAAKQLDTIHEICLEVVADTRKCNDKDITKQIADMQEAMDASNKIIMDIGNAVSNIGNSKELHKLLKEISTSLSKITYDIATVNKNVMAGTKWTSNLTGTLDETLEIKMKKIEDTLDSVTTSQSHMLQGIVDIHQKLKDMDTNTGGKRKEGWFTILIDSIF